MTAKFCSFTAHINRRGNFVHFFPDLVVDTKMPQDSVTKMSTIIDKRPTKTTQEAKKDRQPRKKGRKRPNLDFLFNSNFSKGPTVEQIHYNLPDNHKFEQKSSKARKTFKVEYRAGQYDDFLEMNQQVLLKNVIPNPPFFD